jgi:hypothetical protein
MPWVDTGAPHRHPGAICRTTSVFASVTIALTIAPSVELYPVLPIPPPSARAAPNFADARAEKRRSTYDAGYHRIHRAPLHQAYPAARRPPPPPPQKPKRIRRPDLLPRISPLRAREKRTRKANGAHSRQRSICPVPRMTKSPGPTSTFCFSAQCDRDPPAQCPP